VVSQSRGGAGTQTASGAAGSSGVSNRSFLNTQSVASASFISRSPTGR
jgi:hypothetical protein